MAGEHGLTRERLLTFVLILSTGIAVAASIAVAAPLMPALTWALALAIIANPLNDWLRRRLRSHAVAAGLAVLLVAVLLLGPMTLVMAEIARQATDSIQWLRSQFESGAWQAFATRDPRLAGIASWLSTHLDLGRAADEAVGTLRRKGGALFETTVWTIMQFFIALYALFFFFRDREKIVGAVRSLVPLSDKEASETLDNVRAMIHASVYGNIATSVLQGALGGLMFWFLGLPAALLWGVAMFLFSLVPSLEAFLVWGPAAAYLALSGSIGRALIMVAWGILVVGTIDNVLYPILVGRNIRMHTLAMFVAFLGGLLLFGASGLVLGPVILAITFALIDILRRRTAHGQAAERRVS